MISMVIPLIAMIGLMVSGCAITTPIKDLGVPPVTIIEGTITQLDQQGFTLTDSSGSIMVRAQLSGNKTLNLSPEENVKVYGNLQGGPGKLFDGYVIEKQTGERIIVTKPTPHFGLIIQSAFE